jgi:hypothetical protein
MVRAHFCSFLFAAALGCCALSCGALAWADSIGVNFSGGADFAGGVSTVNPGTLQTPPGSPAGLVPQYNWNNIIGAPADGTVIGNGNGGNGAPYGTTTQLATPASGFAYSATALVADHAGTPTATSTTVTFSGATINSVPYEPTTDTYSTVLADSNPGNPNALLMNNYLDVGSGNAETITVKGISLGSSYDLIVYTAGNAAFNGSPVSPTFPAGNFSNYAVNGGTPVEVVTGDAGTSFIKATATQLGNYVEFDNLTGSMLTLQVGYNQNDFRSPVDGIQLVAVVPEPASFALGAIGLGLATAVGLARKLRSRMANTVLAPGDTSA